MQFCDFDCVGNGSKYVRDVTCIDMSTGNPVQDENMCPTPRPSPVCTCSDQGGGEEPPSQDCEDRKTWLVNNYQQYGLQNFPEIPSRAEAQQFLHVCESKCPEVPGGRNDWDCTPDAPAPPDPQDPEAPRWEPLGPPPGQPTGEAGKNWNPSKLFVLNYNTQAYCMSRDCAGGPFHNISKKIGENAPYDMVALQETGENGEEWTSEILKNVPCMVHYGPGHGVSVAWNGYRFDHEDYGQVYIGKDALGPGYDRYITYVCLVEKTSKRSFVLMSYHGCIGGCSKFQDYFQYILQEIGTCDPSVTPVFCCDCQGAWADGFGKGAETSMTDCWNVYPQRAAPDWGGTCGDIDFMYFSPEKMTLVSRDSWGGTCGCSIGAQGCACCPDGSFLSDHAAFRADFDLI